MDDTSKKCDNVPTSSNEGHHDSGQTENPIQPEVEQGPIFFFFHYCPLLMTLTIHLLTCLTLLTLHYSSFAAMKLQ